MSENEELVWLASWSRVLKSDAVTPKENGRPNDGPAETSTQTVT